ncbi:MarR family transcriptional regulator [Chromatiaceae bacterium AAb-1]|nr:MarR family transcriptional regulator [Chromatiaceae bacterium AAb-1]
MDRAEFAMQQWQKERPDINPFPMKVWGRLAETTQRISQQYFQPFFSHYGLQSGEFDVLATLRRSGKPFALTPTALYEALLISSGGITNRLDRLEKAALIERRKHPTDRRGTLVILTEQGLQLIDNMLPLHIANEEHVLQALDANEQQQLDKLLGKLLNNLPVVK